MAANHAASASSTSSSCSTSSEVHVCSDDKLVSPKPVITTFTKQAEISATEKFVGAKKSHHRINGAVRSGHHNTQHLSSSSQVDDSSNTHVGDGICSESYPPADTTRAAFYWSEKDDPIIAIPADDGDSLSLVQNSFSVSGEQAAQIHGTKPKRKIMLSLGADDNPGVRFVPLKNTTFRSTTTVEDNSHHRKLIAHRVARLASDVFGLDAEEGKSEPFGGEATPNLNSHGETPISESVTSADNDAVFFESFSAPILYDTPVPAILVRVINPIALLDDRSQSDEENFVHNDLIASSTSPNLVASGDKLALYTTVDLPHQIQHIQSLPVIRPSLMPMSQDLGKKRERRKEVLTNGSLRRIALPNAGRIVPLHTSSQQSQGKDELKSDLCITSEECDKRQKSQHDSLCDNVEEATVAVQPTRRPNSLDIKVNTHPSIELTSALIKPTPDIAITPSQTPKSCGLINPGFVFEFTASDNPTPLLVEEVKPVNSPSLLDILHKKYWANSSPSSTLTRKQESSAQSPASPTKTSVFRARHESYCRVVDQNADTNWSQQTLPTKLIKNSDGNQSIRMFGDVSQMFSTLPSRTSPEHKNTTSSELEKRCHLIDAASADDEPITTPGLLQASVTPATGNRLTRKFSLSPRVIRRKIIAKLQQESDKTGSSGSEADDQIVSLSRFKLHKEAQATKKRTEHEIETLEAITWLAQAGFPQYVQLFEDSQLPVDLDTVQRDHSFLDEQQLESLYRRINTLNKSVHMKVDINSKKPLYASGGEDEEEEACVLSDRWCYERASGRWSHIDTAMNPVVRMRSCSSRDSVMTDETTGEETADSTSPELHTKNLNYGNNNTLKVSVANEHSQSESGSSTTSPKSAQPTENKIQSKRNGGFFQRHVGSLTRRSSQKTLKRDRAIPPLISGPTLVNSDDMTERIQRLGCVQLPTSNGEYNSMHGGEYNSMHGGLLRSISADQCCDNCSISSTLTEYHLPSDYVHGTFPKVLLECDPSSRQNSISQCTHIKRNSANNDGPMDTLLNRRSVYDNLPGENDSPPLTALATPSTLARRELDTVLRDLLTDITNLDLDSPCSGMLENSRSDSAVVSPTSEELSSITSDTRVDTSELTTPELTTPEQQRRGSREPTSSNEELCTSIDNIVDESVDMRHMQETVWRERRDSGVGSSLTREPSERKKKVRLRWHSFVASHRPSFNSLNEHISSLSASQLMYLKRLALLKVTSLMEQYSPSHKSGFSLQLVNRFMKKGSKVADYSDKAVFGVPLSIILQNTGQPLPQCILHAMRFLRKSAPDSVGIFRKSGVKSRIQKLRNDLEQDPDNVAQFDSMQAYDVADMFKQYLRELPECLVTNKLSDTFLAIYQHVPQDLRLEAIQACALLLPDENREVLESLLYFLSDMASYHEDNQMTASNLAVCFAPSLFNIHNRSGQSKSPKTVQKGTSGVADQKEFQEQRSATDCLTAMITDCKKVFRVPEDFLSKCSSSSSYMGVSEPAPLSLLGAAPDYHSHVDSCIQGLLKESKDKGWVAVPQIALAQSVEEEVDVSYKKVHDSNPLRLWKCSVEVEADPEAILERIVNERQKWDEDLLKWRTVEKLDNDLDVFQYVTTSMAPQPSREYLVLRAWKSDLPKGACAVVMHSIDHEVSSLGGGIRGMVLASHYLIEPNGPHSKLTHISRIDSRGRQAKWYNRSYGIIAANNLVRVKDSFTRVTPANIHETKV